MGVAIHNTSHLGGVQVEEGIKRGAGELFQDREKAKVFKDLSGH